MVIRTNVDIFLPNGEISNINTGDMIKGSIVNDIRETDTGIIIIFRDGETHIFNGMPYVLRTVVEYDWC